MKRIIAIVLTIVLMCGIVISSEAVCKYKSFEHKTINRKVCNIACGFLGIFYTQDSWTDISIYRCINGKKEEVRVENAHNGNCCP